jgi:hypothetical protein
MFLIFFVATYLGHIAADYLLQSDRIAQGKVAVNRVGFRHVCEHGAHLLLAQLAWIILIAVATSTQVDVFAVGVTLAINVVTHILVDWGRRGPQWWGRVSRGKTGYLRDSQPTVERLAHTHGIQHVDQALHIQLLGVGALVGTLLS